MESIKVSNAKDSYASRTRAFIAKQYVKKELTPQSTLLEYLNAGKSLDDWLTACELADR